MSLNFDFWSGMPHLPLAPSDFTDSQSGVQHLHTHIHRSDYPSDELAEIKLRPSNYKVNADRANQPQINWKTYQFYQPLI